MADVGSFTVNGQSYSLPDSLTMGEMCDAENYFGVDFGDQTHSSIRMAAALMWIAIKRVDPTVTVEDVRELPTDVFDSVMTGTDAVHPPAGTDESSEPSGEASVNGGGHPDDDLASTGSPGSGTGSDSALLTSKT